MQPTYSRSIFQTPPVFEEYVRSVPLQVVIEFVRIYQVYEYIP